MLRIHRQSIEYIGNINIYKLEKANSKHLIGLAFIDKLFLRSDSLCINRPRIHRQRIKYLGNRNIYNLEKANSKHLIGLGFIDKLFLRSDILCF